MRSSVRTSDSASPSIGGIGVARYSVSCMSRAGCSAGMFSASKQCHSSSTSGPSTIANPIRVKISSIRSRTMVNGWRRPSRGRASGQRHVDAAGRRGVLRRLLVGLPPRLDRRFQRVGVLADVLLLIGRRAANQLHPRRDDAVLASEVAVAERLGVADGRRGRELALERGDMRVDGFGGGKGVGHERELETGAGS